jgi:hypothetical protein
MNSIGLRDDSKRWNIEKSLLMQCHQGDHWIVMDKRLVVDRVKSFDSSLNRARNWLKRWKI